MTRKSEREIERDVAALEGDGDVSGLSAATAYAELVAIASGTSTLSTPRQAVLVDEWSDRLVRPSKGQQ